MDMDLVLQIIVAVVKIAIVLGIVLGFVQILIWMERKGAAYFQDRRGPNRANIFGIRLGGVIHNVADSIKLFMKEEFFPAGANRFYFILAPFITMFIYFVVTAVIPFGDNLKLGNFTTSLRISDLNVGVLYIFSMAALAVYGIMLAGGSSNNKYSLFGGLRASSQMISYEITLGLAVVSLFMVAGSVDLNDIVRNQGPTPWSWNVFRQPLAFVLFLIASFAEANRTPFDLPEGDSELVAGFHVEYSSMKFALFMMGEYVAIVVSSAVIVSLFFGGWQVPFLATSDLIQGASIFLPVAGLGVSLLVFLIGVLLLSKFRLKKYKDARKYEVLVLGLPAITVAVVLALFVYGGGFAHLSDWTPPVFAAAAQVATFLLKVFLMCFFFIWIRWTLPRFRYDQLMSFGWKGMLPLALANILITGVFLLIFPA